MSRMARDVLHTRKHQTKPGALSIDDAALSDDVERMLRVLKNDG